MTNGSFLDKTAAVHAGNITISAAPRGRALPVFKTIRGEGGEILPVLRPLVPPLRVQAEEVRHDIRHGMAAIRRLLQDFGNDRREFRHRADEGTAAAVGIPDEARMAAPAHHAGRRPGQLRPRTVHLLHGALCLGRLLLRHEGLLDGMEVQHRGEETWLPGPRHPRGLRRQAVRQVQR